MLGLLFLQATACAPARSDRANSGDAQMLTSWNETPTRAAIADFVDAATEEGGPGYITPAERVAVFDNDGTLWSEKPFYFQFFFAMDRARDLAEADPTWASTPLLESAAEGDAQAVLAGGEPAIFELVRATHSGMPVEEFSGMVSDWLATAKHPENGKLYKELTFKPMVELLDYLRANGFKVYIVSGGGIDFIRAFAEEAYGIPPENVVGSRAEIAYQEHEGRPQVVKQPAIEFLDDKAGKPVGIMQHIGRRPVIVGGNSDGDFAMAEWSHDGDLPSLAIMVHHTDGEREFAYDRDSASGRLDNALEMQGQPGWVFVDMAQDWNTVWGD
jgi:phosphoglycolate phosphatase-like HAD superfamily hydrolase